MSAPTAAFAICRCCAAGGARPCEEVVLALHRQQRSLQMDRRKAVVRDRPLLARLRAYANVSCSAGQRERQVLGEPIGSGKTRSRPEPSSSDPIKELGSGRSTGGSHRLRRPRSNFKSLQSYEAIRSSLP